MHRARRVSGMTPLLAIAAKNAIPDRGFCCGDGPRAFDQSQYTNTNNPSQTTSTKCQYQAAASNPKW